METGPSTELTAELIRAARALIRISTEDLAREASLGVATVRRAEASADGLKLTAANTMRLIEALERRGVIFLAADEHGGPGVRLRAKRRSIAVGP